MALTSDDLEDDLQTATIHLSKELEHYYFERLKLACSAGVLSDDRIRDITEFHILFTVLKQVISSTDKAVAFCCQVLKRLGYRAPEKFRIFACPEDDFNYQQQYPKVDCMLTVLEFLGNLRDHDFSIIQSYISNKTGQARDKLPTRISVANVLFNEGLISADNPSFILDIAKRFNREHMFNDYLKRLETRQDRGDNNTDDIMRDGGSRSTTSSQQPSCHVTEHDSSKEEHQLMKLAKEGLINGRHVKLRALKGILIGGPGVGKTITFKRLTNRRGNIEKNGHSGSTGVEKPDAIHLYRDIENASVLIGKHWSPQPLEGQLSTYLHCLQRQNQPLSGIGTAPTTSQIPNIISGNNMATEPTPNESNQSSGSVSPQPRDKSAIDVQKISSLLKLGKLEDVEKMIEEMGEITVLYMMDLGGQPEYFEILPLLLRGPFLGIIFIDLSLSLTEPFKVTYRHTESTHSTISYTASYCQIDMVHQVLALIDALCPNHTTQSSTTPKSHACLIGTRKDAVDPSTICDFEKKIKELKGTKLYKLLKMFYQKRDFIFPIDNLRGDDNEMKELRQALTDQIYNNFESEEINIRWGIFHLLLRSEYEKPGFCSLDEAVQLGIACGLQNLSNVTDTLKYLHFRFGTILYYHEVAALCDRVICDPNLIFRPLTKIIADSFGAAQHDPQIAEEIRETGIVPMETFNKACKKDSPDHKLLTNDIVELLKYHNILSEIAQNGESSLFMPCLLQPYNASEQPSKDDYLNAFLFTFTPYGFQPIGLFYALTAKLLSSNDFELARIRYRDKISFIFDKYISIDLFSKSFYLEVRVNGSAERHAHVALRTILQEKIDSIMKELPHTKNIKAQISFYCPDSIDKNDPHSAELQMKTKNLKCSTCREGSMMIVNLTEQQKMWFEDSCEGVATDKTPLDVLTAFELTESHSSDWENIGRYLGLTLNDRDVIKKERDSENDRLEAVIYKWIERQKEPPSWMTLITALRKAKLIALAETIKKAKVSVV